MAAAASGRTGSSRATSPRSERFRVTASTRRPSPAQRSATPAAWPAPAAAGSTASGAPLVIVVIRSPGPRCSVVIRRVAASKGSSPTRGNAERSTPTSIPAARAARTRDVSVSAEPPVPPSPAPVGSASLHSATASSSARVPGGTAPSITSSPSAGVHDRSATMAPRVSVPVLSVASSVTEPSVSTAGNERTTAPRRLIRDAPPASASVTTAGSESGTAATARATAATAVISHGSPRSRPETRKTRQASTTPIEICPPSRSSRRCSGVAGDSPSCTSVATRPIALAAPVATTTAVPVPRTTELPACTMPPRSASGPSSGDSSSAERSTGSDSPVSSDSSTCSRVLRTSRASAPTTSPAVSRRTSPRTRSRVGTHTSRPPRSTRALGATRVVRARTSRMARRSWTTPRVVLTAITSTMTAQSMRSPVTAVRTAAPSSTRIKVSVSWASTERTSDSGRRWVTSFGPSAASRAAAASSVRPPSGSTSRPRATSAGERLHGAVRGGPPVRSPAPAPGTGGRAPRVTSAASGPVGPAPQGRRSRGCPTEGLTAAAAVDRVGSPAGTGLPTGAHGPSGPVGWMPHRTASPRRGVGVTVERRCRPWIG